MNKSLIINDLNTAHSLFWDTAIHSPNPTISENGKWSVAQNVKHISIAIERVNNYLSLPKSSIKSNFGLSERTSESYDMFFEKLRSALYKGAKATEPFIPESNFNASIDDLVSQGKEILNLFIFNLQNWSEEDLEIYNCPHPILGKMTVREILYFTIYHAQHHHETIKKINLKASK
jgi:DinB superfamily